MTKDLKLALLKENIAEQLDEIGRLFNQPVHLTLLVRNPASPERNVFITDDPDAESLVSEPFRKSCTETV